MLPSMFLTAPPLEHPHRTFLMVLTLRLSSRSGFPWRGSLRPWAFAVWRSRAAAIHCLSRSRGVKPPAAWSRGVTAMGFTRTTFCLALPILR